MSESPPPYYQEDVLKAEKAAFEALLTDEVQNALQIDVDELLSKTSALNYDFLQVSILLQSVDTQNIGDPLAPTWAGYRTRYLELVFDSERVANTITHSANTYLATIVKPAAAYYNEQKVSKEDLNELNKVIRDFVEENRRNDEATHVIRQGFTTLISDVRTFRNTRFSVIDKFMSIKGPSGNSEKIKQLESKIDELSKQLEVMTTSLQTTAAGSGVGIFASVNSFFPSVSRIAFRAAASVVGSVGAISVSADQINGESYLPNMHMPPLYKRRDLQLLALQKANLEAQMNRLSRMKNVGEDRIRAIVLALDFFREIWAGINTDCQRIGLYMESIELRAGPDRKTVPNSLVTYLQYATTLYYGLSRGLSLYATGLRPLQKAYAAFLTGEVRNDIEIKVVEVMARTEYMKDALDHIRWTEYRQKFFALLAGSEDLASVIRHSTETFLTTIEEPATAYQKKGKATREDLRVIILEIDEHIQEATKKSQEAEATKQRFDELIWNLKSFSNGSRIAEQKLSEQENKSEMQIITSGLQLFGEIWALIRMNYQTINVYLKEIQDRVSGDQVRGPILLVISDLRHATTLYHSLHQAVALYLHLKPL